MQLDGRDKERRKQLAWLLSRSNKAMREGIQLSEAITVDGGAIFRHACGLGLEGIVSKRLGSRSSAVGREEPAFRAAIWVTTCQPTKVKNSPAKNNNKNDPTVTIASNE